LKTAAATVAPSPLAPARQILDDVFQVHYFIPDDKITASDYPILQEKKISLEHDGDIQAVLREISKLAQHVCTVKKFCCSHRQTTELLGLFAFRLA
jgi:hypothetical protein